MDVQRARSSDRSACGPDRCHPVDMRIGGVRQYCSSIGELVSSISRGASTWDQTWQAASEQERKALARTIFAGSAAGLAATAGLRPVLPAVGWLFYYGLWVSLYAWKGRSRSIADVPGTDSGVLMAVGRARELGLDIPRFPNWTRDVFRALPTTNQPNASRLARWLDWCLNGPVGVAVGTALIVTVAALSQQQQQPEPVNVRVLGILPLAFGLVAAQRVYLHRQSERGAFAAGINREVSTRLTGSGPPGMAGLTADAAPGASSDAANSILALVVVPAVIALAVGLFFYLVPPLPH